VGFIVQGYAKANRCRYHGGWLAPKIYFLGCAGSVLLDGIRIAGASGIFNASHFRLGEETSDLWLNS